MPRTQRSKGTGSLFRKTPKGSWIASYWDHTGKRREHSTRTTHRQAAERTRDRSHEGDKNPQ